MATSRVFRPGVQYALWALAVGAAGPCAAATLDVRVVDEHGAPIELVAVYAVPDQPVTAPSPAPTAVMDQTHNAFVPQLLVVQAGTSVDFPNHDSVSHHVYSFSEAKKFELALYKGNAHPPIVFDNPGIVVLGCNIHDEMVGYIDVVDTPYFAATGRDGEARLADLPAGGYTVHAWTPRARPADLPAEVTIEIDGSNRELELRVSGKLQQGHDHGGSGLSWERY